MSSDMYNKIKSILKIEEFDPEFILYTGSLKNAKKQAKLITYLGKEANDNEETGYDTERLTTDPEFLCNTIFCILKEIGTNIPKDFPE